LTTTAYEPLRAGGGVGDGAAGVGVGDETAGVNRGEEEGVGVGAAAVGCEQAAIRKAMPTSRVFITDRTPPVWIGYEIESIASYRRRL